MQGPTCLMSSCSLQMELPCPNCRQMCPTASANFWQHLKDPACRERGIIIHQQELFERTRGADESWVKYADDVRRLVEGAYPMGWKMWEHNTLRYFISGIPNWELGSLIGLRHPANIEEAISLAAELEAAAPINPQTEPEEIDYSLELEIRDDL